jgi:ribose transport system ATP-binding protein
MHMLGKQVESMFPAIKTWKNDSVVLEVQHLTTNRISDVSFQLYKGEILGIAGLVGSGRTELARAIYGLDTIHSGEILLHGKRAHIRNPQKALKKGIFLAPEDRKGQALVQERTIREGITLANTKMISRFGFCKQKLERSITNALKDELNIRAPSVETLVKNLSGGNQQKVVIAKAVNTDPDILIFDEPTQGIDVGAKSEIYYLLGQLRESGKSIIFISSEIEELQGMCSRILVMRHNTVAGILGEGLLQTEKILGLMYRSDN